MSKICIVVGHGKSKNGGYDSGAVYGEYHEFRIAKEIAKYAQQTLVNEYGVSCDLMNYDGNLYLQDRINRLKDNTYAYIAEIHLNAGGGTGTEVYYSRNDVTGRKYAENISNSIARTLGITSRGAKTKLNAVGRDYFGIIRSTKPTANLVETVFIDRQSDLDKVKNADGQKLCGQAIASGIAAAMGVQKKTQATAPTTPTTTPTQQPQPSGSFRVRIKDNNLNIRSGAGTNYKVVGQIKDHGVYTIVETKGTVGKAGSWGKLKSGAGWISLNSIYVTRL